VQRRHVGPPGEERSDVREGQTLRVQLRVSEGARKVGAKRCTDERQLWRRQVLQRSRTLRLGGCFMGLPNVTATTAPPAQQSQPHRFERQLSV
jgi:hypothetical protein